MAERIDELIDTLGLEPHPEGGHFHEVHRSPIDVLPADARPMRAALTTIYFLLAAGEHSRVHRVESDEIWHHYEGDPLELVWWDTQWQLAGRARLGPVANGERPVVAVPAGCWQAAFPTGDYTLVGCTVGPGFDFADFRMLGDDTVLAEKFRTENPQWAYLL
jgi:hypothetical protein